MDMGTGLGAIFVACLSLTTYAIGWARGHWAKEDQLRREIGKEFWELRDALLSGRSLELLHLQAGNDAEAAKLREKHMAWRRKNVAKLRREAEERGGWT